MSRRDVRACLSDVRDACERIAEWTTDRTLEEYREDSLLRAGVERQFEIIGEAINRARKEQPEIERTIPDARRVIEFRNFLIHGYHLVDDEIVWRIIQDDMPKLRGTVDALLGGSHS